MRYQGPAPKITFQFNAGDPFIGQQTVNLAPVPPWDWPSGLAGLLWIANQILLVFLHARTRSRQGRCRRRCSFNPNRRMIEPSGEEPHTVSLD